MIQKFVDRFMEAKPAIRAQFAAKAPGAYKDIVEAVVRAIHREADHTTDAYSPDPERIHEINDGDYQGTLLFVIASDGYQPDDYWFVKVSYGSCSGCDTLEHIHSDGDYGEPPNEAQLDQYMTLALHVVQGLKPIGGEPK